MLVFKWTQEPAPSTCPHKTYIWDMDLKSYFYLGEGEEHARSAGAWVWPLCVGCVQVLPTGRWVLPACWKRGSKRWRKKRSIQLAINQLPAAVLTILCMNGNWVCLYLNVPLRKEDVYLLRSEFTLHSWCPQQFRPWKMYNRLLCLFGPGMESLLSAGYITERNRE